MFSAPCATSYAYAFSTDIPDMEPKEFAIMDRLQQTNWWYRGRRFMVRLLFKKFVSMERGKFLDVGCGAGEGKSIVAHEDVLVGLDVSDEALALAARKGYGALRRGSAEHVPAGDREFDAVLMLDVLEHVDDDHRALCECHRILSPSGLLFLTVPAYQWLWSGHDEVFGHRRRYTRTMLIATARSAGFTIVFCSYFVALLLPVIASYRLAEKRIRNARCSHFFRLPSAINAVLYGLLCFEGILLRMGCRLPAGSSIVLVARKNIGA